MSIYTPPSDNTPIFDDAFFSTGDLPLTYNQAVKKFLRYPIAQGTQNLLNVNISGTTALTGRISQNLYGTSGAVTDNNIQFGDSSSLALLTTGTNNVAAGYGTLDALTTGSGNVAVGHDAGTSLTTGSYNVAIGRLALNNQSTLSNTIAIGYQAASGAVTTGTNSIAIGNLAAPTQLNSNCIVLNATGSAVNSTVGSATYIAPVRSVTTGGQMLYYNTTSKEMTVQSPILNTGFPLTLNLSSTEYATAFAASTSFLGSYVSNAPGTLTTIAVSGTNYQPLSLTIPVGIFMVTLLETIVVTTPPTAVTQTQKTLSINNAIGNPIPGTYLMDTPTNTQVTSPGTYQNQYTYIAINTSAAAYAAKFVVRYIFTAAGSFTTIATATTVRIA